MVPVANLDGTVTKQAMSPIRFATAEPSSIEDIDPTVLCQAPLVGQHSREILAEYGYSDADVAAFLADKVVTIDQW